MHGLGNDFVIIDLITQGARLQKSHIKRIADRKFGVGCDQVIFVLPPTRADADFYYKIFNADGHEVEQCGNGVRCAARFFYDNMLTNKTRLVADCLGGTANLIIRDDQQVTVEWSKNFTTVGSKDLNYPKLPKTIHNISVGNPHGVCIVEDLASTPIQDWGQVLSKDPMYSHGANIGFMQIIDRQHVKLRVFERGAGLTLACGSGACAAMLVGRSLNLLDDTVTIAFEYGELIISYLPQTEVVTMTGPAANVFIGRFKI